MIWAPGRQLYSLGSCERGHPSLRLLLHLSRQGRRVVGGGVPLASVGQAFLKAGGAALGVEEAERRLRVGQSSGQSIVKYQGIR